MTRKANRPIALIILDGWGVAARTERNAIALARTPFYDEICSKYPSTSLAAAGVGIGLADGQTGNAEIGHIQMGAGRVVNTVISRISKAVRSGAFFENEALKTSFENASGSGASVHLIGMLSDGDVHSSSENLYALLRMAKRHRVAEVFVHGILDGRDVPQRTADVYVEALEIKMADIGVGRIATLCGRFYAMDGGENWERTARAFTMLVHAEGERSSDPVTAVRSSFLRGISDEFIAPIVIESEPDVPVATVKDGDLVIFFNHRADTMRQLARSLAVPDPGGSANASKPKVNSVCLTQYDRSFGLPVAFESETESNVLASILAENGIENFRISETDRFQHVTRFFNCGADETGNFEEHIHISSGDVAMSESEPEMRSFKVADRLIAGIESDKCGLLVANFSAGDIAAESGDLSRTIEAVQYVDTCLGGVMDSIRRMNGIAVITSSHGNCEEILEKAEGLPRRSATSNPVPFHLVDEHSNGVKLREGGSLPDIAPTILALLGIEKPLEMTGSDIRIG